MNKSALTSSRRSPLLQTLSLKGSSSGKSSSTPKELGLALPLTSLIDAFCIIVIYLLIGTQANGVEAKMPGGMNLPQAEASQSLDKEIATLRIEKGNYFLNDKQVARQSLGQKLSELKKSATEKIELMVQADTQMEYADLDPLLRAGSEAGIEKLRFAVIPTR
jgi:biopolymer transport protein ExbD